MKIYKIVDRRQWELAQKTGQFKGAEIDLKDGYIHFSTENQFAQTLTKHFSGRTDLLRVVVESEGLGEDLKWEPSRGGDLFPHLYRALQMSEVESVQKIEA